MLVTDTGLIRSSITLLVILLNLDRGHSLSDKPACRSVTEQNFSQVNKNVSYSSRNITQKRQQLSTRAVKINILLLFLTDITVAI